MPDPTNPLFDLDAGPPDNSPPSVTEAGADGKNPLFELDDHHGATASPYDKEPAHENLSWSDVPGVAMHNAAPSAVRFGKALAQPILHPIDTASAMWDVGRGGASKAAGALGAQQDQSKKAANEAQFDAMTRYFRDRYGSEEGWKNTLGHDPLGFAADFSTFLGMPEAALGKVPGVVGKAARASGSVADAVNPLNAALRVTKPVRDTAVNGVASTLAYPLGWKSGTSGASLNKMKAMGRSGNTDAWDLLQGNGDPQMIVDKAHAALSDLADQRRSDYLASQRGWQANQATLPFNRINAAVQKSINDVTHGGKIIDPEAYQILKGTKTTPGIEDHIMDWQTSPPVHGQNGAVSRFDNIDGLDKLKRLVGTYRAGVRPGSVADKSITEVMDSIRQTIMDHDQNYHEAMGRYGDASDNIDQIRRAFAMGNTKNADIQLRKLVQGKKATVGTRNDMIDALEKTPSGKDLSGLITAHALHSPWSLQGTLASIASTATGAAQYGLGSGLDATALGAHALNLMTGSPRLVGSAYYKTGQHLGDYSSIGNALRTIGRSGLKSSWLAPSEIDKSTYRQEPEEKAPYFEDRSPRASGGRTSLSYENEAAKWSSAVEKRLKHQNKTTEPLLEMHDDAVTKALRAADKYI